MPLSIAARAPFRAALTGCVLAVLGALVATAPAQAADRPAASHIVQLRPGVSAADGRAAVAAAGGVGAG